MSTKNQHPEFKNIICAKKNNQILQPIFYNTTKHKIIVKIAIIIKVNNNIRCDSI